MKRKRAHYKELRKELQFRRTRSARRRIRSLGQRENRWMGDVNHCLSKALVSHYPAGTLFVLEDLTGIRSATERVRLKDRYVSVSWAYYDLEQKLKYKAGRAGSHVINTDPAYTSQTCPVCGHAERKNRNHEQHLFRCCKCGYRSSPAGAHLPQEGRRQSSRNVPPLRRSIAKQSVCQKWEALPSAPPGRYKLVSLVMSY